MSDAPFGVPDFRPHGRPAPLDADPDAVTHGDGCACPVSGDPETHPEHWLDEQKAPSCIYCDGSGVILEGDTERPCGSCYEPTHLDDEASRAVTCAGEPRLLLAGDAEDARDLAAGRALGERYTPRPGALPSSAVAKLLGGEDAAEVEHQRALAEFFGTGRSPRAS